MPNYRVSLCYTGYMEIEVEAVSENAALAKARSMREKGEGDWDGNLADLQRWAEGDMLEELD